MLSKRGYVLGIQSKSGTKRIGISVCEDCYRPAEAEALVKQQKKTSYILGIILATHLLFHLKKRTI